MTTINVYKSYSFKEKDPVIDRMRTMIKDEGASLTEVSEWSGVSYTTLHNWFKGPTRRPQSASIEAVGRSLGWKREWVKFKDRPKSNKEK